jgi:hypothetical protein
MLNRKAMIIVLGFMLLLNVAIPFAVFAQDVPTPEGFQTATFEAQPTEVATLEPTLEPTPIPVPPPIDPTKVYEGAYSTTVALIAGLVLISFAGIVAAFFSLPPWARPIVLGIAKNALDEGDKIAAKTPTQIDNIGLAELRKALERLEAKQNETQAQVDVVAVKVENNSQNIAQVARSQNS